MQCSPGYVWEHTNEYYRQCEAEGWAEAAIAAASPDNYGECATQDEVLDPRWAPDWAVTQRQQAASWASGTRGGGGRGAAFLGETQHRKNAAGHWCWTQQAMPMLGGAPNVGDQGSRKRAGKSPISWLEGSVPRNSSGGIVQPGRASTNEQRAALAIRR